MNLKFILFTFSWLFLLSFAGKAQCCFIDSINILPKYPLKSQEVKVIIRITTPAQGKQMGTNLVWVRDTVFISGCWFQGNLQSPKSFTDTFNIGKLNTGFYFINFTAQDYHYLDSCTNNRSITKIRIFKVGSLDHKESKEKTNFRLFPNPTNSSFTLTTQNNTDHKSIEICNAQGQLLLKEDFDGDTYQFKGELNTGIYLIKLSDQRRAYHQKLVVQ